MNSPKHNIYRDFHLIYIFLFLSTQLIAQDLPFSLDNDVSSTLLQFGGGKSIWADMNGDDLIDLILSGFDKDTQENVTKIYFNSGADNFSLSQTLPYGAGSYGDLAVGDIDNDGDLDLFITGNGQSVLMLNDGGRLSIDSGQSFPQLIYSTVEWGDLDNDGDLDMYLMGLQIPEERVNTRIYINEPLGILTVDETQILAPLANGDAAFGDYDRDGDLDLVICGQSAQTTSRVLKIYKNEPTGRLIEDTNQQLTGLKASSVIWADLDTDGDLDLVSTGWAGNSEGFSETIIYRNEPVGTLTEYDSEIQFGTSYGSLSAGDLDADGDVDLLISGAVMVDSVAEEVIVLSSKLFVNNGYGVFNEAGTFSDGISASFGDLNHDGKPDIFINGFLYPDSIPTAFSSLYVNQITLVNQLPNPPKNLSSFVVGNRIILSWNPGDDNESATEGLSYTIRLGTTSEGNDVFSGVLPFGVSNVGFDLMKVFKDKSHGDYYWSVRSIDQGFHTSPWSIEDTLSISRLVESIQSLSGVRFNTGAWVDYNLDNRLDLVLSGISFALGDTSTYLYRNEIPGFLIPDVKQNIESVTGGSIAWGDYDNDGFLDFILSGLQGISVTTFLYRWLPEEDLFIKVENHGLPYVWGGSSQSIAWLDYNLDGYLDLLIGGYDVLEDHWILDLYLNNEGNIFLKDTLQNLSPLVFPMFEVNDMDKDGFIDFVIAGTDPSGVPQLKIYRSDSTGIFWLSDSLIDEESAAGAMEFGDYNEDGLPDLAVTGLTHSGLELKLFLNVDGHFTSTDVQSLDGGIYFGSLDWGDYDNDGDLDLAVSGNSTVTEEVGEDPITRVWINDNGTFTSFHSLTGAGTGTTIWGDYDRDGDLDLLVAGTGPEGNDFAKVFDNLEGVLNENVSPDALFGLIAKVNETSVELSWSQGQDGVSPLGDYTKSAALTYSIRVGTSPESNNILSGVEPAGGGRHGTALKRLLYGLSDDEYYWQTRAIDHGYAESEWSSVLSFIIDTTPPEVDTLIANYNPGNTVIIVVKFLERFGMDVLSRLDVNVTHPEGVFADTISVMEQSFSGNVWTGYLTLPDDYPGQSIKVIISGGRDLQGNEMETTVLFRSPAKVLASHGGTLISDDGRVTLQLSPNSFSEDIVVSIVVIDSTTSSLEDSGWVQIGSFYRIIPDSLVLFKPAVLKISTESSNVDVNMYPYLSLVRIKNDSEIVPLGGSSQETEDNIFLSASINSLGSFGLLGSINKLGSWTKGLSDISCQPRIFSPNGTLFANNTKILFTMNDATPVSIRVFNPAGRLKQTIINQKDMYPGRNVVEWNGKDATGKIVRSGLYIIVIEAGDDKEAVMVGVLNQ